jgi:lipopolysaccharide export system permease protein
MKTIRRLVHREVWIAVAFVAFAFLALFSFFDLVDEVSDLGRKGLGGRTYGYLQAVGYVILLMPSRLYELLPIAVLIGTIFVMARFAQSSEFTILRTSGMGPWRALKTLLWMGLVFTLLTLAIGDYVAPATNRAAQLLKSRYTGDISVGATGAWLKDRQERSNFAVNVGALSGNGQMQSIRIFEFNSRGQLLSTLQAASGTVDDDGWMLQGVQRSEYIIDEAAPAAASNSTPPVTSTARISRTAFDKDFRWPTSISAEMVSVALLKPERMRTLDLFTYIRHLQANAQNSQRYEIEFWRKLFYPLSCLVMVALALPFAYLHFRSGAISGYVFGGVMVGISFFLLNNVFGYIGNLNNWQPWLAAAAPGFLYMLASLGAFLWLVTRQ